MAQILLGPLVTDIAGSIGGTTFQRGASGTQVRRKPLPILRRTSYTNPLRAQLAYLSRLWSTLTTTERGDWQTTADAITWHDRFGNVIPGFGYWAFLQANQALARLGLPYFTSGGATTSVPAFTAISATLRTGIDASLAWSSPLGSDADYWLELHASPPLSGGKSSAASALRVIAHWDLSTTSPHLFATEYLAAFGRLGNVGEVTFLAARCIYGVDGALSELQPFTAYWS